MYSINAAEFEQKHQDTTKAYDGSAGEIYGHDGERQDRKIEQDGQGLTVEQKSRQRHSSQEMRCMREKRCTTLRR